MTAIHIGTSGWSYPAWKGHFYPAYLLDACGELGDRLGPVLFQTPPWLKKDVSLLKNFLALLPSDVWGAFEFRSTSWFDEEVYDALRERNAALVVADTGEAEKDPLQKRCQ